MLFKFSLPSILHRIFIFILVISSMYSHVCLATENEPLEIKLKAAYIYNFLRFVEWLKKTNKLAIFVFMA